MTLARSMLSPKAPTDGLRWSNREKGPKGGQEAQRRAARKAQGGRGGRQMDPSEDKFGSKWNIAKFQKVWFFLRSFIKNDLGEVHVEPNGTHRGPKVVQQKVQHGAGWLQTAL